MAKDKILIIDDSKVIRLTIRNMLPANSPYLILEAANGEIGLKLLRQEYRSINLIVLDCIMPKMTGWEVLKQIQSDTKMKEIPLVLMTGRVEEFTEANFSPLANFECLQKPFDKQQLQQAVARAIAKVKQKRQQLPKNKEQNDRPKEYDAVLGGQNKAPIGGAVLGGIEGVKMRLATGDTKQQIAALKQALNYGEVGIDLLIAALRHQSQEIRTATYFILKERKEAKVKRALIEFRL
jgi:CheY-like chemotaxis protein